MPSELGQLIQTTREGLGLSLRELAKRIQKSPAFLVKLETEAVFPAAAEDTLRAIARVLSMESDNVLALARKTPEEVQPESPLEIALYRRVKDLSKQQQEDLLRRFDSGEI